MIGGVGGALSDGRPYPDLPLMSLFLRSSDLDLELSTNVELRICFLDLTFQFRWSSARQ